MQEEPVMGQPRHLVLQSHGHSDANGGTHSTPHCPECQSQHLLLGESPQYFDLVICEDCGAELTYGELRKQQEAEDLEQPPLCIVEELE